MSINSPTAAPRPMVRSPSSSRSSPAGWRISPSDGPKKPLDREVAIMLPEPALPEPTGSAPAEAIAPKSSGRVFLVVIDDSPELRVAIRYACLRARKTGGRVALLYVIDDEDIRQFIGVGEVMRAESRQEAEALVQ